MTSNTKHYIEWFFPGVFVSETLINSVPTRTRPAKIPKDAYAYRFFDRLETKIDGETLIGKPKNFSGKVYLDSEIFTLENVKSMTGDHKILISNMENSGMKNVVRTKFGQFFPYNDNDSVEEKEKKERVVYKVAYSPHFLSDKYFSARTPKHTNLRLEYMLGRTTYPIIGKIFVFDSLENAQIFRGGDEIILKGIATNVTKPLFSCNDSSQLRYFWKEKQNKKKMSFIDRVIKGTLFADSFMPTEIVVPQSTRD